MNTNIFININKIIEQESKASTYKFALLRGVIDIIQDNSPYIEVVEDRVIIPTGLLIEKWLLYYYPIFDSTVLIPQINGNANLAFGPHLKWLTGCYKSKNGFSAFYNDLKNKGIPRDIQPQFIELVLKIKDTILKMPMKYIGSSINMCYYSIFKIENARVNRNAELVHLHYLIESYGTFSIPKDYYDIFKLLGSFIIGKDSILFKWAEFSVNASRKQLSIKEVLNEAMKDPITERDILASKSIYQSLLKKEGNIHCVWSGDMITNYDIDHIIPFSVWKNNDLWNLLPAKPSLNNQKKDKIPSKETIDKKKDLIVHYWELISSYEQKRFEKEIQISLLGNYHYENWQNKAIEQLKSSCEYLIQTRGFQEWKI